MKVIPALLVLMPLLAAAQGAIPPAPPPHSSPSLPAAPASPPPEQESAAGLATVPEPVQSPGAGQWVYTTQYGWIWMPYAESFVYRPSTGAVPQMYVYYPAMGWTWVVAPWVWGLGAAPYFGVVGPARFLWWGRGYGHWYGFSGQYAHWAARGYWSGGRWYGHRDVFVVPHRNGAWIGHGEHVVGHEEHFAGHEEHFGGHEDHAGEHGR